MAKSNTLVGPNKMLKRLQTVVVPNVRWMPLYDESASASSRQDTPTWAEIVEMNAKRLALLSLARDTEPVNTVMKLSLVPRTVIPRILRHPLMWLVLLCFILSATLTRLEFHDKDVDSAVAALEGSGPFVAFMVMFYVGYCYTRYNSQFEDVQDIMNAIVNACLSARATFTDVQETHRLWRYLNLLHASAYCGMTDYLTKVRSGPSSEQASDTTADA